MEGKGMPKSPVEGNRVLNYANNASGSDADPSAWVGMVESSKYV